VYRTCWNVLTQHQKNIKNAQAEASSGVISLPPIFVGQILERDAGKRGGNLGEKGENEPKS